MNKIHFGNLSALSYAIFTAFILVGCGGGTDTSTKAVITDTSSNAAITDTSPKSVLINFEARAAAEKQAISGRPAEDSSKGGMQQNAELLMKQLQVNP